MVENGGVTLNIKFIKTPLTKDVLKQLKAGDIVSLSGVVYTARDAAHKRMIETLDKGEKLPFDIRDSVIYYVGPTSERPGTVIGSAGPTSSYRMDDMTIPLLELGLGAMIGKGARNKKVIESMVKHQAVYFLAISGAGAFISKTITKSEVIAYDDLGTEAIRRLEVENLFLIVCADIYGNNLYSDY